MTRKTALFLTAAALFFPLTNASAATQPSPGLYQFHFTVTSVTPAGGATCPAAVGDTGVNMFHLPAPGSLTVKLYEALPGSPPAIYEAIFAKPAPAAGVTTYNSAYTAYMQPANINLGTFTASNTLTYIDANSFVATTTETVPPTNGVGTCTQSVVTEAIRSGT